MSDRDKNMKYFIGGNCNLLLLENNTKENKE